MKISVSSALGQRIRNRSMFTPLSCSDIGYISADTLPQKANPEEEISDIIHGRHIYRQYDTAGFR